MEILRMFAVMETTDTIPKSFSKRVPYRNKRILQAAKGEACTIMSPICNNRRETVVACHSNWAEHGKGAGQKADDCFVAFGCSDCHLWLDVGAAPDDTKKTYFYRGMAKTWRRLLDLNIIK